MIVIIIILVTPLKIPLLVLWPIQMRLKFIIELRRVMKFYIATDHAGIDLKDFTVETPPFQRDMK
jgi:hypothetical protein